MIVELANKINLSESMALSRKRRIGRPDRCVFSDKQHKFLRKFRVFDVTDFLTTHYYLDSSNKGVSVIRQVNISDARIFKQL